MKNYLDEIEFFILKKKKNFIYKIFFSFVKKIFFIFLILD
jgi:hypothetical protein